MTTVREIRFGTSSYASLACIFPAYLFILSLCREFNTPPPTYFRALSLERHSYALYKQVCATVLKKICRKSGIPRWPHRKVRLFVKSIVLVNLSNPKFIFSYPRSESALVILTNSFTL